MTQYDETSQYSTDALCRNISLLSQWSLLPWHGYIPAQNLARMAEEQRAAAEKQAELMTANWRQWEAIDTRAVEPRTDRHVESRSM